MKPRNMDTPRDVEETDQLPLPQREMITMLERKKERKKERRMKPPNMDTQRDVKETDQLLLHKERW